MSSSCFPSARHAAQRKRRQSVPAANLPRTPRVIMNSEIKAASSTTKNLRKKMAVHKPLISQMKGKKMISKGKTLSGFLKDFASERCFGKLSKRQLSSISHCFTVTHVKNGEYLKRSGDPACYLYVLVSGKISMKSFNRKRNELEQTQIEIGDIFGATEFIHDFPVAEMVAISDACVLTLSRDMYMKHHTDSSFEFLSEYILESGIQFIANRLRDVIFFSALNSEQLWTVASMFQAKFVQSKEIVVRQGEPGDSLLVISNGEVAVTTPGTENEFEVEIARMTPGTIIGELSLVQDDYKRLATVRTVRDSVLLQLHRYHFAEFLETAKQIHCKLRSAILDRAAVNETIQKIPLFESIPAHKIHLVGTVSSVNRYPYSTVLIEQGEKNDRFFVVRQGEVNVLINNTLIRKLVEGDYFGEMTLFTDADRASASVTVSSPEGATFLECSRTDFRSLFLTEPGVLSDIQMRILGERTELRHVLSHPKSKDIFTGHCTREYAGENVNFWQAVNKLHVIASQLESAFISSIQEKETLVGKVTEKYCLRIHNEFVKVDAPQMININSTIREDLIARAKAKRFTLSMFDKAQQEIYSLMETDNFLRFKESKKFEKMMSSLKTYKNFFNGNVEAQRLAPLCEQLMSESLSSYKKASVLDDGGLDNRSLAFES
mmetsp:Transcript_5434/g.7182  ORF Transcript_5434/g.7182 Transcript_5434/m.7182 type:complete len:662 (+) Transcript_5434:1329-3314(+)